MNCLSIPFLMCILLNLICTNMRHAEKKDNKTAKVV